MSESLEGLRAALRERYVIERALGSGGMATVYLAYDLRHERQVAVKVLKPDLTEALGPERFLREIRITAQLNHPHILPLLDSGRTDPYLYYVMPYVAGGSLRRRLNHAKRLPLDAAVTVTQHVASALEHAHRHGVVHRDIKPENILFSEGLAVVADFGIARAVSTAGREVLTRSGFPLGTPGYMSPEQAAGTMELDERTDVCGLTCVAYEMLVGDTPGVWSTPDEVRVGRFLDLPAGHRERLDDLPGRVEQVLVKGLAIRPAERFAGPVAFASALGAASERSGKLSDGEVREVLERAAQLDAAQQTEDGALSVGAVEQIAAEVGIPPARVREAAGLLAADDAAQTEPAAQYRKEKLIIDRVVAGEMTESQHASLVDEIQRTLGIIGHVSTLGATLTWSPAAEGSEGRKLVVTMAPHHGRTRIRMEERFEMTGWRLFAPGWGVGVGALAGYGIGSLLGLPEPQVVIPAIVCAFGGAFLTVTGLTRGVAHRRKPQLLALTDRLATLVRGAESDLRPRILRGQAVESTP